MPQKIDLLLANAAVLTMDEAFTHYEPGAVAVQGDTILAVGPQADLQKAYAAAETIDCGGKVLMPGLVNAHTHVPMTLLRGLADDLRLDVWLMGYMLPVEREFVTPEFVRLGTSLACAELIRSGVTSFADMYYFEKDVAQAAADAGMRALCGQTVLKFPSPDAHSYEESLEYTRSFIESWKDHPLIIPSVAPHAPFTCTDEILRLSAQLALEFDIPLQIHISETAIEVENMVAENDMPVVPYVKKQDLFDAKVLAAHCVHIDRGEMHTLNNHHAGVAHNPTSNLKLGSGVARVGEMLDIGLNVGIGTDGPSSNNDLDMFEEVRLAALLAKGISNDPTALPARTALAMATRIGAQAMHMGHLTGSLEPGKRADLILIDLSPLHNAPRFQRDPNALYAQIVYAAKSTDVSDVMVNGQWLMQDRELTTLNETDLLVQAQDYARRIDAFLIEREQSLLSKLVAIGGALQEESFEVQVKVRIQDPAPMLAALEKPEIEILYHRHYYEYDTYFVFDEPVLDRVRHREDGILDEKGQTIETRSRLTLIGPAHERQFPSDVMLSRSRYLAPADQSLRFYREYFQPHDEITVEKDRLRWRVLYQGTEFYVNLDRLDKPDLGYFLEVKSRTWSRSDAEHKSEKVSDLVTFLGASPKETIPQDYATLAEEQ